MGRIGKPQKRKKNKIKKYGWYKNDATVNKAPKDTEQEIPRKLRELGVAIKETLSGKRNRNKYQTKPDGPNPNGATLPSLKKSKMDKNLKKIPIAIQEPREKKMGKKMQRLTQEATEHYIDNLKPTRPLLEDFKFKQKSTESDKQFMRRVENETNHIVTQSKIADHFDTTEKDQIKSIVKAKIVEEKREKKKKKLKDEENDSTDVEKQKSKGGIPDFTDLQDEVVPFGEVVHAPPVLSVLPKKATSYGHDRPGLRMPELKEAFSKKKKNDIKDQPQRKKGETVKRKHLTPHQQFESDSKRDFFVDAYRQMKKRKKLD